MHFAEELTGRYRLSRRPLPALAVADPSHISCVGNDFGFGKIFSRYIEALGRPGDVLVAISSSGSSLNIRHAVTMAWERNMRVVLLLGKDGGLLRDHGDVSIIVPHMGFADRIQEIHIKVIHTIIYCLEKLL
jgi:D-sedoheptulose 7-phosphate isomerase